MLISTWQEHTYRDPLEQLIGEVERVHVVEDRARVLLDIEEEPAVAPVRQSEVLDERLLEGGHFNACVLGREPGAYNVSKPSVYAACSRPCK